MKVCLAVAFLIAGISASSIPHIPSFFADEKLVSGQVENVIEDASQAIKDAGLDPYYIERERRGYSLRVTNLFNYEAVIEEILSTGLSNIVAHRIDYSLISSRFNVDLELPLIKFSAGTARANAEIFSNKFDFSASGNVDVVSIFVKAEVRINVSMVNGISLRSVDIDFTLGDIIPEARVILKGKDVSDDFNDFVGAFVPTTIREHYEEINELLELIIFDVIEETLSS